MVSLKMHSESYIAMALCDPSKLTVDQLVELVTHMQSEVSLEVAELKQEVTDLEEQLLEQERATTYVRGYADAAKLSVVKLETELDTLKDVIESMEEE